MPKLQLGTDGKYSLTVSKYIVKDKGWKKGGNIGFAIVDNINRPLQGDIYLRRSKTA